jgi:hypothetical protein
MGNRKVLEVTRETFEDKYLGCPTSEGHMRTGKFHPSKDWLAKKDRLPNFSLLKVR